MSYHHEFIDKDAVLPVKALIHGVDHADLHWHTHLEFLMALESAIKVRVEEERHVLYPGDFILINSNQIHSVAQTQGRNLLLMVQIDPAFFVPIYPHWCEVCFSCHSFYPGGEYAQRAQAIRKILAHIVWEINRQQPGYRSRVGSYLYQLANQMFNFPYHRFSDMQEQTSDQDFKRLREIVEYMKENLHRRVTLQEIGKKIHLSYHYLSRFIQEKLGISYQEYLNQLRMDKAAALLLGSNKTIKEIAQETGFSSASSFHRAFRKEFNITPGAYKDAVSRQHMVFNPKEMDFSTRGVNPTGKSRTEDQNVSTRRSYYDINRQACLQPLFTYLEVGAETEAQGVAIGPDPEEEPVQHVSLVIDTQKPGTPNCFYWQRLTCFTRAAEGLRENWQRQLQELQKEIGFQHIRFHGLFADEMMIYQIDAAGSTVYNWTYVDDLFDRLLEAGLKPFIELGFMPQALARSKETIFWWRAHIAPLRKLNNGPR